MKLSYSLAALILATIPAHADPGADQAAAVSHQMAACWNAPVGGKDEDSIVVVVAASVGRDGTVSRADLDFPDSAGMSNPLFPALAASALRAAHDPRCQPLHLPADQLPASLKLRFSTHDLK